MSDMQSFAKSLHKEQLKYAPDQVSMQGERTAAELEATETRQVGAMDEQFPTAKLTTYDEKDKEMVAKLQLSEGMTTGITPFGKMEARDSDFKWAQRKAAAAETAAFQAYFAKNFDLMDPAQKRVAKRLYPEFYAERKKLLKQQTKNLFRLAKIKLEGIESFKDLKTTYLAESGRLDVGPLKNLLNPEALRRTEAEQQVSFQRGLANPFLVYGKEVYPSTTKNRNVESDAWATRKTTGESQYAIENGVNEAGFPPFIGTATNRGDEQWWKVLNKGLPQGAPTPL